jgi:hypothetical protein
MAAINYFRGHGPLLQTESITTLLAHKSSQSVQIKPHVQPPIRNYKYMCGTVSM